MKPVCGRHDERRSFERLSSFAVAVWGQWFAASFYLGPGSGPRLCFHGGARERGAGLLPVFLFMSFVSGRFFVVLKRCGHSGALRHPGLEAAGARKPARSAGCTGRAAAMRWLLPSVRLSRCPWGTGRTRASAGYRRRLRRGGRVGGAACVGGGARRPIRRGGR